MPWKESERSRSTPDEQARTRAADEMRREWQTRVDPRKVAPLLGVVALAAVLWLPLPLGNHGNVNIPCHLLAERSRDFLNQRVNPIILLLSMDALTRLARAIERNRNGAHCASELLAWVFLDSPPVATFNKAERKITR